VRTQTSILAIALLCCLFVTGCATHTGTGALAGSIIGAGTGAIIGDHTGNAGAGAAIGAGLGALTGGVVGSGMDEVERKNEARIAAAQASAQPPMTVADVVHMAQTGVDDQVIISSIRNSGTAFKLAANDIVSLHQQGVSNRVIQAMLDSSKKPARVVRSAPVVYAPAPPPVYVVEPRPTVSIGYEFGVCRPHRHHHWR
jgi:hypothetical protein